MSEGLPRFEGIETGLRALAFEALSLCPKACPDLRGLRQVSLPLIGIG